MSDIENFVADIESAEKDPHTQGSLPSEVVVQSSKFPSTTSKLKIPKELRAPEGNPLCNKVPQESNCRTAYNTECTLAERRKE